MKKTVIAILMITVSVLTGCGNSEKVISGDVKNVTVENAQAETGVAEMNEEAQKAQNGDSSNYSGYVFTAQNVAIRMDAAAEAYINALGEPVSYYESPSCAFGDLDKIYTYSGFEIDTYSLDGVDYVSAVVLKDDSVTTTEGVCIGDSVEKIEEVYGPASVEETNMMVYVKDEMKLCFIIQDKAVAAIEYRSMILE